MRPLRPFILLAFMQCAGATESGVDNTIVVNTQAAVVNILAQPAGRRLVALPALEYEISVAAQCAAGTQAETISIGVADTQTIYEVDGSDGMATLHTTLRIPRTQIAPLAIDSFCSDDEVDAGTQRSLLINAVLSAQVSLRCVRDDEPSVHFEAVPLDVRLVCGAAANVSAEQPQDVSEDRF